MTDADRPSSAVRRIGRVVAAIAVAVAVGTGCDTGPLLDLWLTPVPDDSAGRTVAYHVAVDPELDLSPAGARLDVSLILNHPRGWRSELDVDFVEADHDTADVVINIASPDTVDAGCAPLRTGGRLSCRNGPMIWLNSDRWNHAVEHWTSSVAEYRAYLINHEMGHFLGFGHTHCPGPGEAAPVMQQQTKHLDGCRPNGWLLPSDPVAEAL